MVYYSFGVGIMRNLVKEIITGRWLKKMSNLTVNTKEKFSIQQIAAIGVMTAVICAGTFFTANRAGTDFTDELGYLFCTVYVGGKKRDHQLSGVSTDRTGGSSCIFRIYQWSWKTVWTDRRLSYWIYSNGYHSRNGN